jgi:hypothetical protein
MAKRRRGSFLVVVAVLILLALLLAFPASGDPEPCPKDWTLTTDYSHPDEDRNSNVMMCSKDVNGKGNDGQGGNVKDDREPRLR